MRLNMIGVVSMPVILATGVASESSAGPGGVASPGHDLYARNWNPPNSPPPAWIPSITGLKDLARDLGNVCSATARTNHRGPLAVLRGVRGGPEVACGNMVYITDDGMATFDCESIADDPTVLCYQDSVNAALWSTFPRGLRYVVGRAMNLSATARFADLLGPTAERLPDRDIYRLKWFARNAAAEATICWPLGVRYNVSDMSDPLGFVGSLLIDPPSLGSRMHKRIMDYPPSFPTFGRDLTFKWDELKPQGLISTLEEMYLAGNHDEKALREVADSWAGLFGRVAFHAFRTDETYAQIDCPGCQNLPPDSCAQWIVPKTAAEVAGLLHTYAKLRIPIRLGWNQTRSLDYSGPGLLLPAAATGSG